MYRTGPVADLVLHLHTQLCEGAVVAVRLEDGVIAKSLVAASFGSDDAVDDAFEFFGDR